MAVDSLDNQLDQVYKTSFYDQAPEKPSAISLMRQSPAAKSGVGIGDMPAAIVPKTQTAKFSSGDRVHRAVIVNDIRKKVTGKIGERQLNSAGYWEYQLLDASDNLLDEGAWYRENELSKDRKA